MRHSRRFIDLSEQKFGRLTAIRRVTPTGVHPIGPTREYRAWSGAKDRCYVTSDTAYNRYGGRGIAMCDDWRNSFEKFAADMGPCPPKHTIDRINNDGDYEPGNC